MTKNAQLHESPQEVYTTSRGYTIQLKPVSPYLINDIPRLVPPPEPPTYKVKVAGGDEQEFPHDESTLQTDEDRVAWAQYQAALKIINARQMQKLTELLILEGMELPEPTPEWRDKMKHLGYDIPEDPYAFRKFYLERELLGAATEIYDLIIAVMSRSQDIPEEAILAIQEAFKSSMAEFKARFGEAARKSLETFNASRKGAGR